MFGTGLSISQNISIVLLRRQSLCGSICVAKSPLGRCSLSFESEVLRTHLQLAEDMGVVVEDVIADSPAAKAGLRKHDIHPARRTATPWTTCRYRSPRYATVAKNR